ncbi:hypothetical protein BC628DRAFT_531825 [Trametes gibbosa]|nr:hypothetical protein BC628DRAFT_531825 [Trametes gibbosa]
MIDGSSKTPPGSVSRHRVMCDFCVVLMHRLAPTATEQMRELEPRRSSPKPSVLPAHNPPLLSTVQGDGLGEPLCRSMLLPLPSQFPEHSSFPRS